MHLVTFIRIVEKDNACYWEEEQTYKAVKTSVTKTSYS
jgi:uncharacterized protein YabN with tetrapyrrole methylase and pyrophosphatase domain